MASARRAFGSSFWLLHGLLPLALGGAALAAMEASGADLRWSDRFFRPEWGGWYLRKAWWADALLHRGGRLAVVGVALGALGVALAGRGDRRWAPRRRPATYVFATIALCGALIGVWKAASDRPCPWDVDRYGGRAAHVGFFAPLPAASGPGGCFPSAHAGTGFSLFAFYFALRDRSRRAALAALAGALAVGIVFGAAQVARGAHFASHNVVSALVCWYVALALYSLWLTRTADAESGGPAAPVSGDASISPASRR